MAISFFKAVKSVATNYWSYVFKRESSPAKPLIFWIEPTNVCNLKCPMCPGTYSPASQKKGFMDIALYKKIIDEISLFSVEYKLLQGGEPLLHPRIAEMVAYGRNKGMYVELDSNGTTLTAELSHQLIQADLNYISFSFDGYDKQTYESIRVNARFEQTIDNIKTFLKIRQGYKKQFPFVRIKSIIQSDSRFTDEKRNAFLALFEGLPVDEFDVQHPFSWNNKDVASSSIFAVKQPSRVTTEYAQKHRFHPCPRLWSTLSILWDGTVVPCCADFYGAVVLGNVNEKSITEIWNDVPMLQLRAKNICRQVADIPLCCNCDIFFWPSFLNLPMHLYGITSLIKRSVGYRAYRFIYRHFS